jgi:branched-chain amino acid transport system substrate-binding protein
VRLLRWLAITAVATTGMGYANAESFRIALVENAADLEAQHAERGFRLGLEYATQGALSVGGRAFEVTVLDNRQLAESLRDSRVDLAVDLDPVPASDLLQAAQDFKHVLLLARGDASSSSRYVFRTAPTSSQLALACVMALGAPELNLFAIALDTAEGRDAAAALKDALEHIPRGVFFAGTKFIRADEPDIGAAVSSEYDDWHYLHGAKTLLILSNRRHPPVAEIAATNPGKFGIRLALCGDIDPDAPPTEPPPALEGVTSYFHALPRNAANDWLVAKADERAHEKPDAAMAEGMAAAIAMVEALTTAPLTVDTLISPFEGLSFDTPKGRMTIRPEDHQALQSMYQFRTEPPSNAPQLVREIGSTEIPLPLGHAP